MQAVELVNTYTYLFQFPNGFSPYPLLVFLRFLLFTFNSLTDSHKELEENHMKEASFQFPNGFSLKPYIPVPLSGCVHLTLSTRVI